MQQNKFVVEGRNFRTENDRKLALRDKARIDDIKSKTDFNNKQELEILLKELEQEKYRFHTILGRDFKDKVEERIQTLEREKKIADEAAIEKFARNSLKKKERRRKLVFAFSFLVGFLCIGYFGYYMYQADQTQRRSEELASQIQSGYNFEDDAPKPTKKPQTVNKDTGEIEVPDVLEKYKKLYNSNKKLIGWLEIADTKINYPVMQGTDNEYYLKHNVDGKDDRNGALFLDYNCDVINLSTNLIIYGHHMSSGVMFGTLDKYSSEEYYKKHPIIKFDTIYEEAEYEVMYVFRSEIYKEDDITFKYYQFINAYSEQEFDSYMNEMEALSLYDTGVRAKFGDHLLTLSTCDYYTKNGRFVVVAKKKE